MLATKSHNAGAAEGVCCAHDDRLATATELPCRFRWAYVGDFDLHTIIKWAAREGCPFACLKRRASANFHERGVFLGLVFEHIAGYARQYEFERGGVEAYVC